MKVIIQIPAYNEAEALPISVPELPTSIEGVTCVEWLVIDDGSHDGTSEVAKRLGVHHVVRHQYNRGLAKTFMTGIEACLRLGADIIVNTDADNQYSAKDIPNLVRPIIEGKADFVIGERPILETEHFSFVKKMLQKLGSFMVRVLSQTAIQDAPSGFRAISRDAALRLNVFSDYTYTLETIIQAGQTGIRTLSIPIQTNGYLRPSRLVKSIPHYVRRSLVTMFRVINIYKPFRFFLGLSILPLISGSILVIRWAVFFSGDTPATHIPSLLIGIGLIVIGLQLFIFGLIADIISVNRRLLEDIQYRQRKSSHS